MRYDSDLHEPRTNAEQSETGDDLRVSYESVRVLRNPASDLIVALTGPVYAHLESLRKGIKMARPFWPAGETVYFIGAGERFVKIGFTKNLTSRVCDLQGANPMPLRVLARVSGGRELEKEYHRRFADARHFYEWFRLTPEIEAEIARLSTPSDNLSGDTQNDLPRADAPPVYVPRQRVADLPARQLLFRQARQARQRYRAVHHI